MRLQAPRNVIDQRVARGRLWVERWMTTKGCHDARVHSRLTPERRQRMHSGTLTDAFIDAHLCTRLFRWQENRPTWDAVCGLVGGQVILLESGTVGRDCFIA